MRTHTSSGRAPLPGCTWFHNHLRQLLHASTLEHATAAPGELDEVVGRKHDWAVGEQGVGNDKALLNALQRRRQVQTRTGGRQLWDRGVLAMQPLPRTKDCEHNRAHDKTSASAPHTWTTSATVPSACVRSLESYLTSRGMPEPASGLAWSHRWAVTDAVRGSSPTHHRRRPRSCLLLCGKHPPGRRCSWRRCRPPASQALGKPGISDVSKGHSGDLASTAAGVIRRTDGEEVPERRAVLYRMRDCVSDGRRWAMLPSTAIALTFL